MFSSASSPSLFQAEDGIRDGHVTGVQTCALPISPAHAVYTGVLFHAMEASDLTDVSAERRAAVHVMSGLFGIVGIDDRIPAYRLSMGAKLPELGTMRTWWKKRLRPVLDEAFADDLVVDCRSADYRAAWPGRPDRT